MSKGYNYTANEWKQFRRKLSLEIFSKQISLMNYFISKISQISKIFYFYFF